MAKKKKEEVTVRSSAAEYLTYVASVGDNPDSFEVRYQDESIWITQKMMAALYAVDVRTINYHIKKIFSDSELDEDSVIRKFRITAEDGKNYNTNHYNLQMIIAVGFKVNNQRAVRFRVWANQIVEKYTIKDWAERIDIFLQADDQAVLHDTGKITAAIAKAHAETEFEKYRVIQDRLFMSDYDKYLLELEEQMRKERDKV